MGCFVVARFALTSASRGLSAIAELLFTLIFSVYSMMCRELLMKNCECAEEGTRNVVAECLGKLALIDPVMLLPKLKSHLARPSALIRSTVITAVKFTISDQVRRNLSCTNFSQILLIINDKNCSLTIVLTAMYQKLQKSYYPPSRRLNVNANHWSHS